MKQIIVTENAPAPVGPYNQAVIANGVLYISGQIAINPTTKELVMDDIKSETRQVMTNIMAVLHEAKAFNKKNTSRPISYDHLLNARRFHAIIYKEDNDQGDRGVNDYINDNALMQLLESDRIKEIIRNIEIDMWNY